MRVAILIVCAVGVAATMDVRMRCANLACQHVMRDSSCLLLAQFSSWMTKYGQEYTGKSCRGEGRI
jgi:hypothetical protein